MSVRVNTNIDAIEAQRQLGLVSMDFSKAVQRLSSGLRINSAADDAAGLAISQKLKTQITGFDQGSRNAQDAISMVQTSESALNTTQQMLQRMRQLAVEAANGTYTDSDRKNIQAEINQLISEIDRISQQTDFNTKKLLDGSTAGQALGGGANIRGLVVQAGVAIATTFSITAATSATRSAVEAASAQGSFFTQSSSITITGALGTQTFTAQAGESLEDFFQIVNNSGIGVTMGVDQNTSTGAVQIYNNYFGINTGTGLVITGPGAVTVVDNGITYPQGTVFTGGPEAVTVSAATGDFSTTGLCMQFATAAQVGQIGTDGTFWLGAGSNAVVTISTPGGGSATVTATGFNSDVIKGTGAAAGLVITLSSPGNLTTGDTFVVKQNSALQFQVGANSNQTINLAIDSVSSQALGVGSVDVLTQSSAEKAIVQFDRAIQNVSAARANMGAIINRLTNSVTNDEAAQENAMAANSRIEDVNVAAETVQFTRAQILLQAGTSILAQANQSPSGLLGLLR
jgi:flagellin